MLIALRKSIQYSTSTVKRKNSKNLVDQLVQVQYVDSVERGVSPPRGEDGRVTLVNDEEEARFEDQTEPVFLDIHSLDGNVISHMKVYLFSHGKCQELQGREPASLVSGFLKYLRKYYPAPR